MVKRKRAQDTSYRARTKSDHWVIVHYPWFKDHYKSKPVLTSDDIQDIASWLCIIFQCQWGKVHTIQHQAHIPLIIAKLDLDVDVRSRFGRYNWHNFLRSPTPHEQTKYSMIFEYNYAQFGDQGEKQWKESYPLPRLPLENFPIIPSPPPPTWCERPGARHGHFDWSIPLQPAAESSGTPNPLTSSTILTPVAHDCSSKLSPSPPSFYPYGAPPGPIQSLVRIQSPGDHNASLGESPSNTSSSRHYHPLTHFMSSVSPAASGISTNIVSQAVQPEPLSTSIHPSNNDGVPARGIADELKIKLEDGEVMPKFKDDEAKPKLEDDDVKLKLEDDWITPKLEDDEVMPNFEDDDGSSELGYPDEDAEVTTGPEIIKEEPHLETSSFPSDMCLLVKNPFGIQWPQNGLGLPVVSDTHHWLQQFIKVDFSLHVDTSNREVIMVRLLAQVDLHGILGRHIWEAMLDDCPIQWKTEVSTVVRCKEEAFQGSGIVRMTVPNARARMEGSTFRAAYPPPLPFMHEFEPATPVKIEEIDEHSRDKHSLAAKIARGSTIKVKQEEDEINLNV